MSWFLLFFHYNKLCLSYSYLMKTTIYGWYHIDNALDNQAKVKVWDQLFIKAIDRDDDAWALWVFDKKDNLLWYISTELSWSINPAKATCICSSGFVVGANGFRRSNGIEIEVT